MYVEVLLGGEGLVVEGSTAASGAPVQLGVQPQPQLTPGAEQREQEMERASEGGR